MTSQILLFVASLLGHLDPAAAALSDWAREAVAATFDEERPQAAVQIDLLPDPETAQQRAASLRGELAAGGSSLEVFVEPVGMDPELPRSYRVGVGPFSSFEDAERARLDLAELGVDGFLRELEPLVGC